MPYKAGYVTWPDFKKYLGDYYFNKNAGSTLCEYRLDPARPAVAKHDALLSLDDSVMNVSSVSNKSKLNDETSSKIWHYC